MESYRRAAERGILWSAGLSDIRLSVALLERIIVGTDRRGHKYAYDDELKKRVSLKGNVPGKAKERLKARHDAGHRTDHAALSQRLGRHRGQDASRSLKGDAARAARALRRHHGEHAAARIEELAERLEDVLSRLDGGGEYEERAKAVIRAKLRQLSLTLDAMGEAKKAEPVRLSTADVAKHAQVAPRTVSKWVDQGALPGERDPVTGNRTVSPEDLAAFFVKHDMKVPDGLKGVTPTPPDEFERKRAEHASRGSGAAGVVPDETGRPVRDPVGVDGGRVASADTGGDTGTIGDHGSDSERGVRGGGNGEVTGPSAEVAPELDDYLDAEWERMPKRERMKLDPDEWNAAKTKEWEAKYGAKPAPPPAADEPGKTGFDSLGREWRDGELVAKQDEAGVAGSRAAADNAGMSGPKKVEAPPPGKPVTYKVHRGTGRGYANDHGVAGKGEYWSGDAQTARAYAGKSGDVKTGDVSLERPLVMNYRDLNALQEKLYGKALTGFEPELSERFDGWLREQGYDGVVLFDPEISGTIPQEVVKLAPKQDEAGFDAWAKEKGITPRPGADSLTPQQRERAMAQYEREKVNNFQNPVDNSGASGKMPSSGGSEVPTGGGKMSKPNVETATKRIAELEATVAELTKKRDSRVYGGGALSEIRANLKRAESQLEAWREKLADATKDEAPAAGGANGGENTPPNPPVTPPGGGDEPKRVHGRIPLAGGKSGSYQRKGKNAARVGEIVRDKNGQRRVITGVSSRYVSDDQIEDNDDWASYPQGPGHYTFYDAVPVEDSDEERAADQTAKQKVADAAAEKKKGEDAWKAVAEQPGYQSTESKPEGLPADLKWELVRDTASADKFGNGERYYVAALPDGRKIGRRESKSLDDYRTSWHVPAGLADDQHIRDAEEYGIDADEAADFLKQYSRGTSGGARAEAVLRASPEVQARLKKAAERKREYQADNARETELFQSLKSIPHDSPEYDAIEAERRRLQAKWAGGPAHRTINLFRSGRESARMKEFEKAVKDAHGIFVNGSLNTPEESAQLNKLRGEYEQTGEKRLIADALAVAEKIKARRVPEPEDDDDDDDEDEGQEHYVTGNTFPHKDTIRRLGGRWDAANKRWIIPASVAGRLPRGLSSESL